MAWPITYLESQTVYRGNLAVGLPQDISYTDFIENQSIRSFATTHIIDIYHLNTVFEILASFHPHPFPKNYKNVIYGRRAHFTDVDINLTICQKYSK